MTLYSIDSFELLKEGLLLSWSTGTSVKQSKVTHDLGLILEVTSDQYNDVIHPPSQ